jgi:hypothetical protein
VVDTSGAPVSDASMTVSSPSMATTALTPADAVAAGRFELTADSGGTPLKWGSYTASVSAPGKLARTVTFDAHRDIRRTWCTRRPSSSRIGPSG